MSELDELKKENKKLRALLKNAVELLNKYKDVVTQAGSPPGKKKSSAKKKKLPK